jgi:hypothetical protein
VKNVVVAWPLYKHLPVAWFTNFMLMDRKPLMGWIATNAVYVNEAFRLLKEDALRAYPDFERLVFMEADMLPPAHAFARISEYPPDYDIVGSVYFGHRMPHHAMAWMEATDQPGFRPIVPEAIKEMVDRPAAYPVDAVGFGFTSITRRVFECWDDGLMFDAVPPVISHDLSFCKRAREQGFKVWLDSGIVCGHLTETLTTYEMNQACKGTMDEDFSQRC